MKENFNECLDKILVHEGGWSDHPKDPGGATMKGVTLATFRRHYGQNKTKEDLRRISKEQLREIYRKGYWDACKCDQLPSGIDYTVFDGAVNSGPRRSAKWLQSALSLKQDGVIGGKTIAKANAVDPVQTIDIILNNRLNFLMNLRTWPTFGRGWGARVSRVRLDSKQLAMKGKADPPIDYSLYETVMLGSGGKWVVKLQYMLGVDQDGIFGPQTEAELIAFQKEAGIVPDGIAGPVTYKALGLIG